MDEWVELEKPNRMASFRSKVNCQNDQILRANSILQLSDHCNSVFFLFKFSLQLANSHFGSMFFNKNERLKIWEKVKSNGNKWEWMANGEKCLVLFNRLLFEKIFFIKSFDNYLTEKNYYQTENWIGIFVHLKFKVNLFQIF